VIVEGKHDEGALKTLGIPDILPINSKPLITVVEALASRGIREVVILTDFDREGRKLAQQLERMMHMYKIESNNRLRQLVRSFGRTTIEELDSLKEADTYGEISANINKISRKSTNQGKRSYRKTRRYRSSVWANRRVAWLGS